MSFTDLVGGEGDDQFSAVTVDSGDNIYFVGLSLSATVDNHTGAGESVGLLRRCCYCNILLTHHRLLFFYSVRR